MNKVLPAETGYPWSKATRKERLPKKGMITVCGAHLEFFLTFGYDSRKMQLRLDRAWKREEDVIDGDAWCLMLGGTEMGAAPDTSRVLHSALYSVMHR